MKLCTSLALVRADTQNLWVQEAHFRNFLL